MLPITLLANTSLVKRQFLKKKQEIVASFIAQSQIDNFNVLFILETEACCLPLTTIESLKRLLLIGVKRIKRSFSITMQNKLYLR